LDNPLWQKEARLIFGAVHDERPKKGEIKITVIATGFSGLAPKPVEAKRPAVNGAARPELRAQASAPLAPKTEPEEWDAVPAFLRRRK
jgi:cell division GTPase FtsZ